MFFRNPKSFIVRFVLTLVLLGGVLAAAPVRALPMRADAGSMQTVTNPVLVTVQNTDGVPAAGLNVYAFNGSTYTGVHGVTNQNGQVSLFLPESSYRFRADLNGTQFWSGTSNHCDVPGCDSAGVTVSKPVMVTVFDTDGIPQADLKVYAFNGSTYTSYSGTTNSGGVAAFTLPLGSYRFRADLNGTQFWSAASNHCDVPGCDNASVTVSKPVTVTVLDTDGAPRTSLNVYAFNGSTYTGYGKTTNADGQAIFTLPLGSYRFRADLNSTQFWSEASNHCDVPGCDNAGVTVSKPVTVTVLDTDEAPKAGLKVYAFNGTTYTGYSKTTNTDGLAIFTLPLGSYRFRADLNGTQFWSGASNHCDIPGCESAQVTVTIPVTVMVRDGGGAPKSEVNVYAFNGSTYTGYSKVSDASGQAIFTLPLGDYRFHADYAGTQYWSEATNHCSLPGCPGASVTVGPVMTATATATLTPTSTATSTPIPTTWVVTNTNDSGPGSLRQAISEATPSATIYFDPALAGETIVLSSQVVINKDLTIDGSGLSPHISISGNHAVRIFSIGSNHTVSLHSLILKDGRMSGTSYTTYGGAIYTNLYSVVTAIDVDFIGNTAYQGGAIYVSSLASVTILESQFSSNSAQMGAGAIYARNELTVKNSVFTNNITEGGGGAVRLEAPGIYILENNAFVGNHALSAGAVLLYQNHNFFATVRNNLFSNNSADSSGGAIRIVYSGPEQIMIENNTFYANRASDVGGAISTEGNVQFMNNTFSENRADRAGGNAGGSMYIASAGWFTELFNNIFANNVRGGECYEHGVNSWTRGNNNLVEDGSPVCMPTITGDPMLGILTDHGGPNQTMTLLPGSPAIDAGDDENCPAIDQRGVTRPQGAHCDIGAYEYDGELVSTTIDITASPNPSEVGQSVATTVTVSSAAGTPEGTVTFSFNGTPIPGCLNQPLTNGVFTCDIRFFMTGDLRVSFTPADGAAYSPAEAMEQHTVVATDVDVTVFDNPPFSLPGAPVAVSARVRNIYDVDGVYIIPAGSVTFTNDEGQSCTDDLDTSGYASCHLVFTVNSRYDAVYTSIDGLHNSGFGTDSHEVSIGTPTPTNTPSPTPITTQTVTPTFTPTSTPTVASTPVTGCNSIRDYFQSLPPPPPYALAISGSTMYVDIPNPNDYPVEIDQIFVAWNGDKGHRIPGRTQELRLMSVSLNGTLWEMPGPGMAGSTLMITAPFDIPAVIPPEDGVTLTFTFDQTYNNPLNNGQEIVTVYFSTPGCEGYPFTVTR